MESKLIRNELIIDWKHVFLSVVKKWWIILLCMIVGLGSGYGLGTLMDKPVYESEAVYVLSYSGSGGGSGNNVNTVSSEFSFITRILYNCIEVVKQNTFTEMIAAEVNAGVPEDSEAYIKPEALASCISYTYATQGTLIYVTVDTPDPELSYQIIMFIKDHLPDYIKTQYQLAGLDSMVFSLINTPKLPDEPIASTTRMLFTLVGGLAFAFICIAVVAFSALLDTHIKKEDDLKNHFNAPVLGTIPNFRDPELLKGGYYHYATRNK